MKPKKRHETGILELFRSRVDQIIDPRNPLVLLGMQI
jgi:hypothetical protein